MAYDFDKIFAEQNPDTPAPAAPGGYDFDEIFAPDPIPLESALYQASFANPDEEAKKQKLAKEMDLRPGIIDIPDAEAAVFRKLNPAGSMLKEAPELAKWLEDEENAKLARDDIDPLRKLSDLFRSFGKGIVGDVIGSTSAGVAEAWDIGARAIDRPIRNTFGDEFADLFWYNPPGWLNPAGGLRELGKSGKEAGEIIAPPKERQDLSTDVAGGVGQLSGQIAAAILTGGAASSTMLFAQGVDQMNQKTENDAANTANRDAAMLLGGSWTMLTERYGIDKILNRLPPEVRNRTLRFLADKAAAGGIEAVQEATEGLLHDVTRIMLTNEDAPVLEGIGREMTVAGLSAGIVRTALGVKGFRTAQQQQQFFEALADDTKAAKLRERMPDKFRDLMDRYAGSQAVYVDAEKFTTYFQGAAVDPAVMAQELGVTDYAEAVARGSDIKISMGAFAERIAPTDFLQGLMEDIKLSPWEMSAREAKIAEASRSETEKRVEADLEAMKEAGKSDAALSSQIKAIVDDVAGQLQSRYDPQTAEQMATLLRGVAVLSQREAVERAKAAGKEATPEEINALIQSNWKRYGLEIRANPDLPEILKNKPGFEAAIDPLLDQLRAGAVPTDTDLFGTSLVEFIRQKGGLQDLGGELSSRDADNERKPFQKNLIQQAGMTFDAARELALEAGYQVGENETTFLDALDNEIRGKPVYALGKENSQAMSLRDDLRAISEALAAAGVDLKTADNAKAKEALFPVGQEFDQAGKRITDSPAFKKWFGDSKVVDENGEPLVVYHGTRTKGEAIDSFDLSMAGKQTDSGWMGKGFYFGDSNAANAYAGHYEFDPGHFPQGGAIYPTFLSLQNPAVLIDSERNDGPKTMARELVDLPDEASADEVREALIAAGYDGVIYQRNAGRGYREYVAFEPTQIKSATGNRGTFDPANPNILYQTDPAVVADLQKQLRAVENQTQSLKYDSDEWKASVEKAGDLRKKLFDLTGDAYGEPKKKKPRKPSDDLLTAEYASPDDVPAEVMTWLRQHSQVLTSDATDAVRFARIVDTLEDDRYPEGDITIYRAVLGDDIRPGDWVTTSREYAEEHNDRYLGGKGTIVEEVVDGQDVLVSPTGNYEEAIYAPRDLSGPLTGGTTFYQTDFVERRAAPRLRTEDLEKPLEEMTQEELVAAITRLRQHTNTNPLTGLPSKAVWEARQAEGKGKAFVASIDADALKWFNDNIGHEPGGNVLLNRIGAALLDAGIDAYHISGDEFYAQADSQEELETALKAAQNELAKTVMTGNGWQVTGAGFSFGIATNMKEAESGLHEDKTRREAEGLRSARGDTPPGAVRADRGDDGQAASDDAGAAARDQQGAEGVRLFQKQEERDLLVQHNMTAEAILHAQKLGGLPVPSLAITKKTAPLMGFGEITLLGSKEMVDPKGYAKTKVFGSDIYSPRYPNVQYQFTANMQKLAEARLKDGREATGGRIDWDALENDGARGMERSSPLMWQFLKSRDIEPKIARKEVAPLPESLQAFANDSRFTHELAADPAFIDASWKALEETLVVAYGGDREAAKDEVAEDRKRAEERGKSHIVNGYARQVNQYRMDSATAGSIDGQQTQYALDAQIEEAGLREEFIEYGRDFFSDIGANERIFRGYTNSGNRKYVPHTLENVVKILKQELRGGENFNYGVGSIRAKYTPQFKSIAEIRKSKDRLIGKAEFEKVKEEIDKEFSRIGDLLAPYHHASDRFGFGNIVSMTMTDAATMGIPKALKENVFTDVPVEAQEEVAEFLNKLRTLPTEYFEAKILREVDLAEFSGAVVPEGTSQKVIDALNERGIKDIRFYKKSDQADRTAKIGEFESLFFQKSGDKPRGSILIGDNRKMRIELLKDANLSTFLHETGHFYLEVLGDMAEADGASQRVRDDYAAILKWMGVKSRAEIQTKHHEMFARANEAYLMEGKSPAVELRPLFARFKSWLKLIYNEVRNLNVQLSDEVRGVFNRIYATDAEIAEATQQNDFLDLFADADAMGVSQAEFSIYVSQAAAAIEAGNDRLRAKMMRVQQLKRETWWKDELKLVRAEVEAELELRREYRVHAALTPLDSELKLDRGDVVRRYGEAILKRLPRGYGDGQGSIYTAAGTTGMSVDSAAELFGYDSGDALIEAMARLRPRARLIIAEADARMSERHGDLLNSIEAADEAQSALHNAERSKKLAMELKALRKLQRQAEKIAKVRERDQANTEAIGRDVANDLPPIEVFREAAKRAIAGKLIRDLRPNDYLLAERKANKKAYAALAKKDYAAAQQFKQQELLNFELFREATRAKAEMDRLHDYSKTFEKPTKRQKLGKAGEQYLEAVDALLQDLELQTKSLKAIDRQKIARWLALAENELYYTPEMAAGEFAKNWQELTVEEMRAVGDALKNLEHVATKQKQIMDGQNAVDLETAIDDMVGSAEAGNKLKPQELSNAHRSWAGKKVDWAMDWMGDLLNVRTMAGWLDNAKADGPWHRFLINRASESQVELFRMTKQIVMPVNEMVERYMDGPGRHLDDEFSTRFGKMTRHQILSIAFNLGNSSNKSKLIRGGLPIWKDGKATPWTEVDVQNLVAKLDAADWAFVQDVWTLLDSQMYPAINELEKRVNGVPMKKVDAVPFEVFTADKQTIQMKGGYYPMSYDPRFSAAGQKQDTGPLAGLVEGGFAYVTTPKGQTKARVENFAAPANLDFGMVLGRHLSQSILDLTHREFFMDAQKLLKQNKVRQALQERIGEKFEKEFNNWLNRIANAGANTPTNALSASARFAEQARTNTTVLFLGFKVTTVLAQFAGLSNSIEKIGAGWMWRGTQEAFSHPVKGMALVMEKSARMQQRWETLDHSIYEAMNRLHRNKYERARDTVNRAAFAGIAMADRMVSTPTWLGAYRKALAEGAGEENAIHAADDAVITSQGDGASMELSKIQGERGFTRLFTVFYTPFAAQFNRLYSAGRKVNEKGMKYTPEFIMRAMLITALPAIIADLLTGRGPKECEIDDPECYAKWAGVKAASSLTATIPLVREAGSAFESWATGNRKPDLKYSPVFSAVERAADAFGKAGAMAEGELDNDTFFKALESSGLFLGLPTAQLSITSNYLYDLLAGEEDGEHWYRDLVFRRAQ
jgi:GGDEF domain-containing protein